MPGPDPLYDDTFIFSPSMLLTEAELDEGKAIGTARLADLHLKTNLTMSADADPANHAKKVKIGSTVGRQKMLEVQERVRGKFVSMIGSFKGGKLTETELRKRAVKMMKVAWRDVFLAGLRSAGIQGESIGHGKTAIALASPQDESWLKTATQHEMRFLNGFLDDIVEDSYSMPLVTRVLMYVKALRSFYESARVIGMPTACVLNWVGPHDRKTCDGCRYLFENSPYTKYTLPTVPASGATVCLSNCRDRILIRRATIAEVVEVQDASKYSRAGHMRNLRLLKAGKSLT